jgi:2,3-bisphosphoglycerate-dependent phosphoglycerate mutase
MPKLLLIRHCAATAQHPHAPLTAAGSRAAEALALRLRALSPDALYSSPYERAHATVRPFAALSGLPVRFDDRLRERVLSAEALADWQDHLRRSFADPDYRAPGGESIIEAQRRALASLADIAAEGHLLPAVVSHGNLIACVLLSIDAAFGFAQWQGLRNPDLFAVELDAGRPIGFLRLDP